MSAVDVALSSRPIQFSGCSQIEVPNSDDDSSILIYLSVGGSFIPMLVLESDSIASVKLRIQTCKGFVVKKQKLVFEGRELFRNNDLVKDYGITTGNVLQLVLKLSDLLLITVRTTCGQEFEFQLDRFRNVGYLKQRIFKEGKGTWFVDVDEQEIFHNGQKLDDQRLIDEICDDNKRSSTDDVVAASATTTASIHLLVQKTAKVRAKPLDKDFEISVEAANSFEAIDDQDQNQNQEESIQVLSREQVGRDFWLEPMIVNPSVRLDSSVWNMVNSTFVGLEMGHPPIRSSEGTGGTYFMRNPSGEGFVSVFKPSDEEPNAVNNPQGLPMSSNGEGLKRGTKVGEGAVREVAAYILDHPKSGPRALTNTVMGFSGVPPTIIAQCLHKGFNHPKGYEYSAKNVKIGSLQMFMNNEGSCEDVGPSGFPVDEVHKITVLDVRMANADRHAGNILISKGEDGQIVLIPIDHGYCLPETFEDCTFDWLYWPQARQPYSPKVIDYINTLDAEYDIALLEFHGWNIPPQCATTLRISTMLLKKGVQIGLTPFDIGSIMCRETVHKESMIEEILREAQDNLLPDMSEVAFLENVSQIMDTRLNKLNTK
ncbi:Phosphatidylinositol 4-kinase gamma 2 [Linum perenne]